MRKLIAILGLLLIAPVLRAQNKTNFVQYVAINETTSTSSGTPVSFPAMTSIGANHIIVVWFSMNSPIATTTVNAPTDTFGISYASIVTAFNAAGTAGQISGWCAPTGTHSGSDTISVSWSPSASFINRAFAVEYSGATCTTDVTAATINQAGATFTTCNAGPITTVSPADLVLEMTATISTTVSAWTAAGGFTLHSNSAALRTGFEDQQNVAAGSVTGNMSWTTSSAEGCAIVALQPAKGLGSTVF